jgi:RHS repeat-associated protein
MRQYSYSYDRLGRLTSEGSQYGAIDPQTLQFSGYPEWTHAWAYDQYGNLANTANAQTNRLIAYSNNYDNGGNQLQDSANAYAYDARNLIKQVTRLSDNQPLGTYAYDAFGRRAKKTWSYIATDGYGHDAVVRYLIGPKGEILGESQSENWVTGGSSTTTLNIHMGSQIVEKWSSGPSGVTIQALHRNHRQEVMLTSPVTPGDMSQMVSYSGAFGSGGSDQFPGQKMDNETGLKDFGARYYNPSLMRWTSADSVTTHIYDPQSLNKYTYVRNDPVNKVDPDGRDTVLYDEIMDTLAQNPMLFISQVPSWDDYIPMIGGSTISDYNNY